MAVIKYKIDGKEIPVEVSDEFAKLYEELENKEKNLNRAETRRHVSLDKSLEDGFDYADPAPNPEEKYFNDAEIDRLYEGIRTLFPQQQSLLYQIYFLHKSKAQIAKELDVGKSAIQNQIQRIFKKLKKFLI